jgi:hypothetical protein
MVSESRGLYSVSLAHVDALQRLAGDPAFAAALGVADEATTAVISEAIGRHLAQRAAGSGYAFVLTQSDEVLGVCTVQGVGASGIPVLEVHLAGEHRNGDNAAFAAGLLLDFVFENLLLDRVTLTGDVGGVPSLVTRTSWQEERNRSAVAMLPAPLRPLLEGELAAGNAVMETRRGWPDAESVFVRLRQVFRAKPTVLPKGVTYSEPNDPHWWRAEYTTTAPRHILAC